MFRLKYLKNNEKGISPAVGVILMVAITVILAGVVGTAVFSFADLSENVTAGATFEQSPEGVTVTYANSGTADGLVVLVDGQEVDGAVLKSTGDMVTVTAGEGEKVTAVGYKGSPDNRETENPIVTEEARSDTTGGSDPTVVSGGTGGSEGNTGSNTVTASVSYNPPVEGVTVKSFDSEGSVIDQATTDSTGSFTVDKGDSYKVNSYTVTKTLSDGVDIELDSTDIDNSSSDHLTRIVLEGEGSSSNPYKIDSASDLQLIEIEPGKQYELVSDIDASNTSSWNGGKGFDPINFTGKLDGNDYTVDGLTIDRPTESEVGLIGKNDVGYITSIGITNVDVSGSSFVGGLVGTSENGGKIEFSYATGSVSGDDNVGGLVGINTTNSLIYKSYSTGNVSGTGNEVGGIVGKNTKNAQIDLSYATGSVSGNADSVGGFVGQNKDAFIYNSYSTGSVSGDGNAVGGFVGFNESNGNINNSYSTGSVSGGSYDGGFVGFNRGTVTNGYWDSESSGYTTGYGENNGTINGGTGLTTSEMQGSSASSNMSNFDFTNTWNTVTGDYPELQE